MENILSWELIEASVYLDNMNEEGGYLSDKYHLVKATFPEDNLKDDFYKTWNKGGNPADLFEKTFYKRYFLVNTRTHEVFPSYMQISDIKPKTL